MFERKDQVNEPLYVLTSLFNPMRFRSRWKLYEDFVKMCECAGVVLYVAEVAYGDRAFVFTNPHDPHHLQLRTTEDLWFKENSLKLLLQRVPLSAKYIAWIDADIDFGRKDWANETIHALQRYDVVQMWSKAYDLDSDHEIIQEHHSFLYSWMHDEPLPPPDGYGYYTKAKKGKRQVYTWHPGFAWAAKREFFDHVGSFIDYAILGAGDNHMAQGLIGTASKSIHKDMTEAYKMRVADWERRALKHINKNVGYVEGTLLHYWHGKKVDRRYWDRWQILVKNKFDPNNDLKVDWQGLYQLDMDESDRMIQMRDEIRKYFRQRNEDQLSY